MQPRDNFGYRPPAQESVPYKYPQAKVKKRPTYSGWGPHHKGVRIRGEKRERCFNDLKLGHITYLIKNYLLKLDICCRVWLINWIESGQLICFNNKMNAFLKSKIMLNYGCFSSFKCYFYVFFIVWHIQIKSKNKYSFWFHLSNRNQII